MKHKRGVEGVILIPQNKYTQVRWFELNENIKVFILKLLGLATIQNVHYMEHKTSSLSCGVANFIKIVHICDQIIANLESIDTTRIRI